MRRLTVAAVLTIALCVPAFAQSWVTPESCRVETPFMSAEAFDPQKRQRLEVETAKIPNGIGRFWRITTPKGKVSYLWGTMHSTDRSILDLPDALRQQITSAHVVALEFDPTPDTRADIDTRNRFAGFWISGSQSPLTRR